MKKEKIISIKRNIGENNMFWIRFLISAYISKYNENGPNKIKLSKKKRVNSCLDDQVQMFFKIAYPPNS